MGSGCRIMTRAARLCHSAAAPRRYVTLLSSGRAGSLLTSRRCRSAESPISPRFVHTTAAVGGWMEARSKDADKEEKDLIVHQENVYDEVAKKAQNKETFKG